MAKTRPLDQVPNVDTEERMVKTAIVGHPAAMFLACLLGCAGCDSEKRADESAKSQPTTASAEITFNSKLSLIVWTYDPEDGLALPKDAGRTPSDTPVRISSGASWGVTPGEHTATVKEVAAVALAHSIQGLSLWGQMVRDADLVHLKELKGLQRLDLEGALALQRI